MAGHCEKHNKEMYYSKYCESWYCNLCYAEEIRTAYCEKHKRKYEHECSACTLEDMIEVAKDPVAPRLHHLQDNEIIVERDDLIYLLKHSADCFTHEKVAELRKKYLGEE